MYCRAIGSCGIVGVDQGGDIRRHRHRVACRDLFQIGEILDAGEALGDQFRGLAQGRRRFEVMLSLD